MRLMRSRDAPSPSTGHRSSSRVPREPGSDSERARSTLDRVLRNRFRSRSSSSTRASSSMSSIGRARPVRGSSSTPGRSTRRLTRVVPDRSSTGVRTSRSPSRSSGSTSPYRHSPGARPRTSAFHADAHATVAGASPPPNATTTGRRSRPRTTSAADGSSGGLETTPRRKPLTEMPVPSLRAQRAGPPGPPSRYRARPAPDTSPPALSPTAGAR